jgi:peroxiredoxin Q/BCP
MNHLVSAVSVTVAFGFGCAENSVAAKSKTSQDFPNVKLTTHTGKTYDANSLRGDYVVVYFYPKDDTPGCTAEAISFRDHHETLSKANVRILGVSTDGQKSHDDFAAKYNLPFELVMDPDGKIAKAFGVPVRMGYTSRQTFVYDPKGQLLKHFESVKVDSHAEDVLKVVTAAPSAK